MSGSSRWNTHGTSEVSLLMVSLQNSTNFIISQMLSSHNQTHKQQIKDLFHARSNIRDGDSDIC